MPGRAIRNQFLNDLESGKKLKIKCPYQCLTACKVKTARFCIAEKLLNSYFGDVEHGLIFCGQNVHRVNKIVSVKELIRELLDEFAVYIPRFPGMIESALENELKRSSSLITPRLSMKSVRMSN